MGGFPLDSVGPGSHGPCMHAGPAGGGCFSGQEAFTLFYIFFKMLMGQNKTELPLSLGPAKGFVFCPCLTTKNKEERARGTNRSLPRGPTQGTCSVSCGACGQGAATWPPFLTPTQSCLPAPGRDWLVTVNRNGLFCLGMDERLLASCISFPDGHTGPHAAHPPPRESAHCL